MELVDVEQEVSGEEEAEGPRDVLGGLDGGGHHVRHVRREEIDLCFSARREPTTTRNKKKKKEEENREHDERAKKRDNKQKKGTNKKNTRKINEDIRKRKQAETTKNDQNKVLRSGG